MAVMTKDKNKNHDKQEEKKLKEANKHPSNNPFKILADSFSEFMDDECMNLSAAIAYYALQSLIPLILGIISIAALFLNNPQTRENIISGVESAIPQQIGETIKLRELLSGLAEGAGAAGIISALLLLWTGSGIFDQFIYAINKAFDVEKDERNFFFKIGLRFAMLLVLGVLLVLAFTITILARLLFDAKVSLFGISPANFSFILPVLAYVLPIIIQTGIFAILYRFSPARKGLRWKPILAGAAFAAVAFELLKFGFTLYVTNFGAADNATKTYGALGGLIVFLLFIYLSGLVILFGAEIAATMHNFKSGLVNVETDKAVVETPAKPQENGQYLPSEMPTEKNDPTKAGLVGPAKAPAERIAPALTQAEVEAQKKSKLKLVIGSLILALVTVLGSLMNNKNKSGPLARKF